MSVQKKKKVTLDFLYEEVKANAENTEFLLDQVVKLQEQNTTILQTIVTNATKEDLLTLKKELEEKMVTKADNSELMGEVQAMREEQAIALHQYERTNKRVDGHDKRIVKIESKIGAFA